MKKIVITLSLMMSACSQNPTQTPEQQTTQLEKKQLNVDDIKPADIQAVSDANNQFAINFFNNQQAKKPSQNIFFSPYSLSTALAMTYEGATGDTAKEMEKVLHFPDKETLRKGSAGIYNQINSTNTDNQAKSYALNTTNALWLQQDFELKPEFTQNVNRFYGGDVTLLDFKNSPETSAKTINRYIEKETNEKIKNLVSADLIKKAKLVLTNAVYFNGTWTTPFDAEFTKDMPFHLTSGKSVNTPFMTQFGEHFPYYENDSLQLLSLPYKGDELSMLVILPKQGKTIHSALTASHLQKWRSNMSREPINLYLPKFKLEQSYELAKDLQTMGMPNAFSDDAEFTQMSNTALKISEVIHKAFIDVNEKGTEAAAATAVIAVEAAAVMEPPKPKKFKADRPFTFVIQQNATGNILFMGRVNDPS